MVDHFSDASYFQQRAILSPTHEFVDEVNDYLLSRMPGDDKVYLSSDSILKTDGFISPGQPLYSTDFLNSIKASGIPNHVLRLKVGVPIMLMRNIDQSAGLCNGTRLITTRLGNHVIEATIMSGRNIGDQVFIPRMLMSPSNTASLSFMFQRRQFPLSVCFAMTINKSQGQSLSRVGLYLRRPVFTHGQLYVAISRVTSKSGLKILSCDMEGQPLSTTTNVVYKEVFRHLT